MHFFIFIPALKLYCWNCKNTVTLLPVCSKYYSIKSLQFVMEMIDSITLLGKIYINEKGNQHLKL